MGWRYGTVADLDCPMVFSECTEPVKDELSNSEFRLAVSPLKYKMWISAYGEPSEFASHD